MKAFFLLLFIAMPAALAFEKNDVDCLEVCLQERGANNFKTVAKATKQCLTAAIGNEKWINGCKIKRKSLLRSLEFNDVQVCNRHCN